MNSALVIDDNLINQKVLQLYLKSYVENLDWAINAKEGFNKFIKGHFNIILIDYHLPDLNGIELLKKMKSEPAFIRVGTVIAITGDKSLESNEYANELFDGILIKPFTRNKLINLLGKKEASNREGLLVDLKEILPLLETNADKAQFFNLLQKSLRHFHSELQKPEITVDINKLELLVNRVEPVFKMVNQTKIVDEVRNLYRLPNSTRVKTLQKFSEQILPILREARTLSNNILQEM